MEFSNEEKLNLVSKKMIAIIRQSTEERVRSHSANKNFNLSEADPAFNTINWPGKRASSICISSAALKINLTFYFSPDDVKKVAHQIYGKDAPGELSDDQAQDFIKEFCNLSAGQLVNNFNNIGFSLEMGLPVCLNCVDNTDLDLTRVTGLISKCEDLCCFSCEDCNMVMHSLIEIIDLDSLFPILNCEVSLNTELRSNEIDFL